MENTISLKEFLDEYGENMAEKITEELEVIHDPLRERSRQTKALNMVLEMSGEFTGK